MQDRDRWMSNIAMFQTLFGLALLLFGLLLLGLNQRLAKVFDNSTKWALGIRPLLPDSTRVGLIVAGIVFLIVGAMYSVHVLTI